MSSKLTPERFAYVYVPDTEYVARPGEKQRPVCLVAHGFHKGRRIEMFFDKPAASPFSDPKSTLFLGYNLPSELKTMLSLGWELPEYCVDLYVEFLNMINGKWRGKDCLKDLGTGLVDAVTYFGGNPMDFWKSSKDKERDYIIQNGTKPPEGIAMEQHQKRILAYCEEDVNATVWLGRQMLPELDLEQALWRGKYCKANAFFEHNGVPVDAERFRAIEDESPKLKLSIANKIEETHRYGVYVIEGKETTKTKPHPVFKMNKFAELLASKGITVGGKGAMWQATPSGDPMLEDDYFGDMCNA